MQVHIHPLVTIYINTLLAWAKCFLATYGVYPGLYDLLDTPRHDFLAAQFHLCDSTFPRPLLHRSRGPPSIRSEYVALQPHLAPSPHPIVCTSIARPICPSPCQSVMCPVRPSSRQPPPPSLSITPSVSCLVHPSHRQSVRHPRLSVIRTIHPPTHHSVHDSSVCHPTSQSCATSVRPSVTIRLSAHHPTTSVRPSATVTPSVRCTNQSVSMSVTSHLFDLHYDSSVRTSVIPHDSPYPRFNPLPSLMNGAPSHTIHHTQDSSQSLAVVNGEQSHKSKKFHRAFTHYDILLCALDACSIYLRDLRRVAPPKSGEDAHLTCGKCDFGGATLHNPHLGCSYVLPRLWDPGGVSSSPHAPRDQSRTIAPSRYPYRPCTGYLVNLPYLQPWQDLRTSHVKLDIFIHGNITGLTIDMKKITGSINVIIPVLT